jgi:hypothetical protein
MVESIQYQTHGERQAIVKDAEARGLIMLHDDFLSTGMVDMNGKPILQKVMQFGTPAEKTELCGPSIPVPLSLYRKRDLTVKMQTEDLTLQELNELKRLGG